ncbi:hypothetical protein [Hypericibacter terrae]
MAIESRPGNGTTVTCHLPLAARAWRRAGSWGRRLSSSARPATR